MRRIKQYIPWQAKLGSKLLISRLPVPYSVWKRIGLFEHGFMDDPEIALSYCANFASRWPDFQRITDWNHLELGPGDSLASAVVATSFGAKCNYLVDVGRFASKDLNLYKSLASHLGDTSSDLATASLSWTSIDDVLSSCNALYLTDGLESLKTIPTGIIDFAWSNAVFEHIRRREFIETMEELKRVSAPKAFHVHRIDLRDHFNWQLNNLRFSPDRWESPLFADSGFYTNRLRHSEILQAAHAAGFSPISTNEARWTELPTPLNRMDPNFQRFALDDLLIQLFDLELRPA